MSLPENATTRNGFRSGPIPVGLLLVAVLFAAGWAYSQGLSGGWFYDDYPNLAGLDDVDDVWTGLDFVLSGEAGPTGRPLSLLTFLPQAESWPDDPAPFLAVNIAIHLFNGLLVFVLSWLIGHWLRPNAASNRWLALAVAAIWTASPFLASASLLVIQRMTLLAGTFTFAGLILYLGGRLQYEARPRLGLILMVGGIAGGTLLGVLAKENGALLPVLALALEAILLQRHPPPTNTRASQLRPWLAILLVVPTALILGYLVWRGLGAHGFANRPFSVGERLMTQSIVLWEYVRYLLAPIQSAVTPFMDDQPISHSLTEPLTTLWAILGWIAVLTAAWLGRRHTAIPLFAVCFFLAGHLIESSVIALELYFAHRNYVPAFGLYFALAWFAIKSRSLQPARRALAIGLVAYWGLMTAIMTDVASTWGNPVRASTHWYEQAPKSARAAQLRAAVLKDQGNETAAALVVSAIRSHLPDNLPLHIQSLLQCVGKEEHYASILREVEHELLHRERIDAHAVFSIHQLAQASITGECMHQKPERILPLVRAAAVGDRIPSANSQARLAYAKAELARAMGDRNGVIMALEEALQAQPTHYTANRLAFQLVTDGQSEQARQLLRELLDQPPDNWIRARLWRERIGNYLKALENPE